MVGDVRRLLLHPTHVTVLRRVPLPCQCHTDSEPLLTWSRACHLLSWLAGVSALTGYYDSLLQLAPRKRRRASGPPRPTEEELSACLKIVPTGLRFLRSYLGFRAALRLAAHDAKLPVAGPGEDTPELTAETIAGVVRAIQGATEGRRCCVEDQWWQLRELPTFFPGVLSPVETHCVRCVKYGWPDSALAIVVPFV